MHNLPNMARQVLESRIGIQLDDLAAKYYSSVFLNQGWRSKKMSFG
jgi:hypothetical protein